MQPPTPFTPSFYDLEERLYRFREEILTRMRRLDELQSLAAPDRRNLASDARVTVDSSLGTVNEAATRLQLDRPPHELAAGMGLPAGLKLTFEDQNHPRLRELESLAPWSAIAGSGDSFARACRLRSWLRGAMPHGIPTRMPRWDAVHILRRAGDGGEGFICLHFCVSLVQVCALLGMSARVINLHRGVSESYRVGEEYEADPPVDEHVVVEVWSDQHQKWVVCDVDYDCYYEHDGEPCSAWDIHQAVISGRTGALRPVRGPHSRAATAKAVPLDDDQLFFAATLPSYYAHVSYLMRADFLSDPDGPIPVLHPTDESTGPILWHRGSDLRLQPHLLGPVVVAHPWDGSIAVLTDGNADTGWASTDAPGEHWVELDLGAAQQVRWVGLVWPLVGDGYRTSARIHVQVERGQRWQDVAEWQPQGPEGFSLIPVGTVEARRWRVLQPGGMGHHLSPDRLWLNQVELVP